MVFYKTRPIVPSIGRVFLVRLASLEIRNHRFGDEWYHIADHVRHEVVHHLRHHQWQQLGKEDGKQRFHHPQRAGNFAHRAHHLAAAILLIADVGEMSNVALLIAIRCVRHKSAL